MTEFKHEYNYPARHYTPIGEQSSASMCDSCETYYTWLYENGFTKKPFPPSCTRHILESLNQLDKSEFESEEELESARAIMDPITWAYEEFGWKARWYQILMLSCTSTLKVLRSGRRIGKTAAMIIESLHHAVTTKDARIIVAAPRMDQITIFFDNMRSLISKGRTVRSSLSRDVRTPATFEFKNGSLIKGFTLNPNQGVDSAVNIRGQDATLIVLDEMAWLTDDDIDVLLAIKASHSNCRIMASSTPSGLKNKLYQIVKDKNIGFKEFWIIAQESPEFTEGTEEFFRNSFSEQKYNTEVLAEFDTSEKGVFKSSSIEKSLQEYDIENTVSQSGVEYILGIDWNKSHGTHIVILSINGGRLVFIKKIIVPESEYTQTDAVNKIIEINDAWNLKYIFADSGYGSLQIETLKKHGLSKKSTGLHKKVIGLTMNKMIKIKDPLTKEDRNTPIKPFIVQQTVRLLDDGKLVLPRSEDKLEILEEGSDKALGLVVQMRNYEVINYSILGQPIYTKENEHTLMAYIIACGGYIMQTDELFKRQSPGPAILYGVEIDGSIPNAPKNIRLITEEDVRQERKNKIVRDLDLAKTNLTKNAPVSRSTVNRKAGNSIRENIQGYKRKTF